MNQLYNDYKKKKDRIEKEYFGTPDWKDIVLLFIVGLVMSIILARIILIV